MVFLAGTKTLISAVAAIAATVAVLGFVPAVPGDTTALDTVAFSMKDGRQLDVSRFEVSWEDWKACYDDGGCSYLPHRPITKTNDTYPVTGVNRFDVDEFVTWINASSRSNWRLPTAAEWNEFAAELPRPKREKLFTDPRMAWAADYGQMPDVPKKLRPQGSWGTFNNGIADLAGNVWEWTSTCAPNASGVTDDARCPALTVEGLHEAAISVFVRNPAEGGCAVGTPPPHVGFRLVRDH